MDLRLPRKILRKTPSRRDGVPKATEEQLRSYGVELIQRAAALLRLRQVVSASAAVILQRFYFRRSLAEFDVRSAAAAALLLAGKLEERHRRLRDVLIVFTRLRMREGSDNGVNRYAGIPTPVVDLNGREFNELRQDVINIERVILTELGFGVSLLLDHPHKYVIQFIKTIVRQPDWLVAEMAQKAWNYLNDSLRTVLAFQYQAHEIATASIFLAAKALKVNLPSQPPWWELFDSQLQDVKRIASITMSLYDKPKARYVEVPRRLAKERSELAIPPFSPGPMRSPSSADGDGERGNLGRLPSCPLTGETFCEWDVGMSSTGGLDASRINELLNEPRLPRRASNASVGSSVKSDTRRCSRSRSPRKRRVVQLVIPPRGSRNPIQVVRAGQ